jgi:uncharacterized protein YfaS (alpha-2-macroglobulin family)
MKNIFNLQVNVTMPAFFFDTDKYLYGTIMANYTSGAPVRGNLTLKATIRPIKPAYRNMDRNPVVEKYFNFVSARLCEYWVQPLNLLHTDTVRPLIEILFIHCI